MGLPHISSAILHSCDLRGWLLGQLELQLRQQKLLFGVGFGAAAQQQLAAIGGRQAHINHLYLAQVVEHLARGQAGGVPL